MAGLADRKNYLLITTGFKSDLSGNKMTIYNLK
jgi:hypothetical protein